MKTRNFSYLLLSYCRNTYLLPSFYRIFLLALLCFAAAKMGYAAQATFHVTSNGSDANSGSAAAPFASLERARQAVNAINANMTGDIEVIIHSGTYYLPATLLLGSNDSGSNGYYVRYKAAAGEIPVLSGGILVTGWTLHDATNNIYKANVGGLRFRQIYVNNQRGIRARTPNKTNDNDLSPYNRALDSDSYPFKVNTSEIANWNNLTQVEMVWLASWRQKRARVASYSVSGTTASVYFNTNEANHFRLLNVPVARSYYFWENAYEFVDTTGEWYLNTGQQTLYYKQAAGSNMAGVEVIVPVLTSVVGVKGVLGSLAQNISFEGLTIRHSNWTSPSDFGYMTQQAARRLESNGAVSPGQGEDIPGAIQVQYASNISIAGCTIELTGAHGLATVAPTDHLSIERNVFRNTAAACVWIDTSATPTGDRYSTIANNLIEWSGMDYTEAPGLAAARVADMTIRNNVIRKHHYSGITIGWFWQNTETAAFNNDVLNNRITETSMLHDDGGSIYSLGRMDNSFFSGNYLAYSSTPTFSGVNAPTSERNAGIYLDNGSFNKVVDGNVEESTGLSFHTNSTHPDPTWRATNNTFLDNFYNGTNNVATSVNTFVNNTVYSGTNSPTGALPIIGAAGLEPANQSVAGSNLALHRPAYMLNGTPAAGREAYFATDGLVSSWMQSTTVVPWDLRLDLGGVQAFDRITIKVSPNHYAAQYSIKGSNDGTNWSAAYFTEAAGTGTTRNHTFSTQSYRYILVDVTSTVGTFGHVIQEIEVYGSGNPSPSAPSMLTASAISSTAIDLSWMDNSNNESGFKIERRPVGAAFVEVATAASGIQNYSDTVGLTSGTTYEYRIRATNSSGNSGYSNTASAVTPTQPSLLVNGTLYPVQSYSPGVEDFGTSVLYNSDTEIELSGNAWKKINFTYSITPETVLTFDFLAGSSAQGEIHGILFDTNDAGSESANAIQVWGTQTNWAAIQKPYLNPGNWQTLSVSLAQLAGNTFSRLVFIGDDDAVALQSSRFGDVELTEGFPVPNDAVAHWALDNSGVDSATIGTANTLTLSGSPTYAAGRIDTALALNGTSQYASAADQGDLDIGTGDFSISCWFYRTPNAAGNLRVLSKDEQLTDRKGYAVYGGDTSVTVTIGNGTAARKFMTGTHSGVNLWTHLAATFDRDGMARLYINGLEVATAAQSISDLNGQNLGTTRPFRIGSDAAGSSGSLFWPGRIDGVRIYQRLLNQSEISILASEQ